METIVKNFPPSLLAPNAGAKTGSGAASTVASGNAPGQPETVPAPVHAGKSAALFGGHVGKKRADGLRPGSPEAKAADKRRDAERKRSQRAERAAAAPPPIIPSAAAGDPRMVNPTVATNLDPSGLPFVQNDPQIVWLAKDVEPLAAELVALSEEMAARQITTRCSKARLPNSIINEIEKDARWLERSKQMLSHGAAAIAAKAANETGISPEWVPVLECMCGGASIGIGHMKILNRLDKLIAANNIKTMQEERKNLQPQPEKK